MIQFVLQIATTSARSLIALLNVKMKKMESTAPPHTARFYVLIQINVKWMDALCVKRSVNPTFSVPILKLFVQFNVNNQSVHGSAKILSTAPNQSVN